MYEDVMLARWTWFQRRVREIKGLRRTATAEKNYRELYEQVMRDFQDENPWPKPPYLGTEGNKG